MERRNAILDAAESLLSEQGYKASTLKAIGERAGIPTASVYHYFSDRHQVDAEILRRHMGELDAIIGDALDNAGTGTLGDHTGAVIDLILDYFRRYPACTELWFAGRHETLDDVVRAFDDAQAERLRHFLIERGLICADTPLLALQLTFEVGEQLFDIAFRRSPGGDDAAMAEARRFITAYLETYAPTEPDRSG